MTTEQRQGARSRALHLRLTERRGWEECARIIRAEFPEVEFTAPMTGKSCGALAFVKSVVGFNEWKSGCHGYCWDANASKYVRVERIEKGNVRVPIRPRPLPGFPMDYAEPTPEEYKALHATAIESHKAWREREGLPPVDYF
ncbi:MAG TPA: hypothetical protein VMU38_06620 [Candidatus Binatia bacterium]|nr:hypothetical protein [Candidatus Binatia bacterium]